MGYLIKKNKWFENGSRSGSSGSDSEMSEKYQSDSDSGETGNLVNLEPANGNVDGNQNHEVTLSLFYLYIIDAKSSLYSS
jgi:hypothetical protein